MPNQPAPQAYPAGNSPMPGGGGLPGGPNGASGPERPAVRPGSATFALFAVLAFAALNVWVVWTHVSLIRFASAEYGGSLIDTFTNYNFIWLWSGIPMFLAGVMVVFALSSAPGIATGKSGARVFTTVWSIIGALVALGSFALVMVNYMSLPPGIRSTATGYIAPIVTDLGLVVLAIVILVLMLGRGMKSWAPSQPATPIVMVLSSGQPVQPMTQQQAPGYGPPQQPPAGYGPPQQPNQPQVDMSRLPPPPPDRMHLAPPQQPPYPPQ
ncbi:hypothetical protein [Glycomyces buryatensis]|uniref:Uncharacterized protein n=1 Tax=Glycomyces buryatensis TaxID=2570927 RepID=A0A4S8QGL0_9ACTN|nr:hypothetical protein [Glycomyces buryatensis]THV43608.1 hypothetical protein FAB82_00700 [Glycomyces buryatensis]